MAKICAVFGGSRGIGKAVAQLLALKGYRLAVLGRDLNVAETTARSLGAGHLALRCDVAQEKDVHDAFDEIENKLGSINYLVNAAGINRDALLLKTSTENMVSQLHTNLMGPMLTCKYGIKCMLKQQGGAVVNIGSIIGQKGNAGQCVYSASKAGLVGFSRALAKEVARKNIRVNVLAPGTDCKEKTSELYDDYYSQFPKSQCLMPEQAAEVKDLSGHRALSSCLKQRKRKLLFFLLLYFLV